MKKIVKLLLLTILLTFIYSVLSYMYVEHTYKQLAAKQYDKVAQELHSTTQTLIEEKRDSIKLVALTLSFKADIKTALLTHDSEKLKLREFSKLLRENSYMKNVWIQLLTKDGTSFYRNWTKEKGDSLVDVRLDVKKIIQDPQTISSISTGKFDMTFKSMVPIYDNQVLLGFVEVLARFNSIGVKLKGKGVGLLLVVDKSYKKQLTKAFTQRFVHDYYIANNRPDKELLDLFKNKYYERLLTLKNYIIDDKYALLITSYRLNDFNDNPMGYFIISKKLSDIDLSQVYTETRNLIYALVAFALIIIGSVYYVYVMQYKKFILNQNQKLENLVKDKTKELYHAAHHDYLTGLPNRLLFIDRLEQMIKHASRHGIKAFVLFLDLDRFKEINDTYGHEVGDLLLRQVALRLQESIREEDTIARLGGDEFTILIQDIKHIDLLLVIEKIIDLIQKKFLIGTTELYTSFSIGISSYPTDGLTTEDLLRNADTAMYKAKSLGKNTYQFYDEEMTIIAKERTKLEHELREALIRNEFVPYFQPKINAKTNKMIGIEALIRWQHPERGLIFPDNFLPFAQEVGLISEIDENMKLISMTIVKKWLDKGLDIGVLSLNVSTLELNNETFIEEVKRLIEKTDFNVSRLEFEILESQSMQDQEEVIFVLNQIRKLGVKIAVDDFGTGYSSLSYLKKLPIDTLKIDRSFVSELPHDSDSAAIVKTIISLANNLNLELIAEGVETKEQMEFLVQEGCENIQGYYYSKPMSAEDLEKYLSAINPI